MSRVCFLLNRVREHVCAVYRCVSMSVFIHIFTVNRITVVGQLRNYLANVFFTDGTHHKDNPNIYHDDINFGGIFTVFLLAVIRQYIKVIYDT